MASRRIRGGSGAGSDRQVDQDIIRQDVGVDGDAQRISQLWDTARRSAMVVRRTVSLDIHSHLASQTCPKGGLRQAMMRKLGTRGIMI